MRNISLLKSDESPSHFPPKIQQAAFKMAPLDTCSNDSKHYWFERLSSHVQLNASERMAVLQSHLDLLRCLHFWINVDCVFYNHACIYVYLGYLSAK